MAKSTMQRTATPVVMMIMIDYGFSNDEVGAIIVLGGEGIFFLRVPTKEEGAKIKNVCYIAS